MLGRTWKTRHPASRPVFVLFYQARRSRSRRCRLRAIRFRTSASVPLMPVPARDRPRAAWPRRRYGRFGLVRIRALNAMAIDGRDNVVIGLSRNNRGVREGRRGRQSRVQLGVRASGDVAAIRVVAGHVCRRARDPRQFDAVTASAAPNTRLGPRPRQNNAVGLAGIEWRSLTWELSGFSTPRLRREHRRNSRWPSAADCPGARLTRQQKVLRKA